MRVLVCGGRDFTDLSYVWNWLECFHRSGDGPITVLIHGAARGTDLLADQWGKQEHVKVIPFPYPRNLGKRGGPIRNARMLFEAKPDCVIAFAGGKGTRNMVQLAEAAGVRVHHAGPAKKGPLI